MEKERSIGEAVNDLKKKISEIEGWKTTIFPPADEISFSIDERGNIISISNVADAHLYEGKPFLSFINEEDRKKAFSYFIKCISGEKVEGEVVVRKEGKRTYIEFIASPLQKEGEVEVRGIAREKEKETAKEFSEFLSFIPGGVCMTDLLGNIIACNEIFANLTHYSVSQINNKNIFDFVDERDANLLREHMGESLEKKIDEWETYIVTREEIKIPIEIHIHYMGEEYNLFLFMMREIVKRKIKEKIAEEEKEKEYVSLSEARVKLLSLVELDKKLYTASLEEACKVICRWVIKTLDFDVCSLLIVEDESLISLASEGKKGGEKYFSLNEEEYGAVKAIKNGREILIPDFSHSTYKKENEWSESQICIPLFVDSRKKGVLNAQSRKNYKDEDVFLIRCAAFSAEKALHLAEVSSSLKTYERIVDKSVEGIYRVTTEGKLLEANAAFLKIFDLKSEEIQEINALDFYVNKEDRKKFLSLVEKRGMVKDFEISYIRRDGKKIICRESAWLVEEGNKKIIEGMIHDISEEVRAKQEVQFYNSLLRHDIYNKNEVAMGYLGLIKDSLSEKQAEIVEKALRAIGEGNKLIETVKKLEKTTEGELKSLQVGEVIEEIIEKYEEDARAKNIEILYTPFDVVVNANDLIEDIFSNLIKNAIGHSHGKTVEIFSEEKGDIVRMYVKDDGIGIPKENKEKIFQQGWKGKGSRGSGLGLYLVKKIVEGFGGKISVEEGNEGACFIVSLKKSVENRTPHESVVGRESEFFRVRW